jgi:hypothetical protein
MVADEIRWHIGSVRRIRDLEFARNDEARSRGTPYVERMKLLDAAKLEWCDREEQRLTKLLASFRVRPLPEWFDLADYDVAKSMGMQWIIRFSIDNIAISS